MLVSSGSAFLKSLSKIIKGVLGDEVTASAAEATAKVAENPGKATAGVAGALGGVVAGTAYEKSKHPIVVEIAKQELASDNSFVKQTQQYLLHGVIHTSPHSHKMYTLFTEHFKKVVSISELSVSGEICQKKVRDLFDSNPDFAAIFYANPHCFQPFGLGDKLPPSLAISSNAKNIIIHGEAVSKAKGLIIDSIPSEENFKTAGLKTPGGNGHLDINNLPPLDPKDPTANFAKVNDCNPWFKKSSVSKEDQANYDKFWKKNESD
jgi:hypothetical protein